MKGIKKLEPGNYLHYSNGLIDIVKYWDVEPKEIPMKGYNDAFERLYHLISHVKYDFRKSPFALLNYLFLLILFYYAKAPFTKKINTFN